MVEIKREDDFDFLSREYGDIFACSDATAFQSPVWLHCFHANLIKYADARPLTITFRKEGELLGLVALMQRKKTGLDLVEATDMGVSDYAAPVFGSELQRALEVDSNLAARFVAAIGPHDLLRVRPVLPGHRDIWQKLLQQQPCQLDFSTHAVQLAQPFDEWRAAHLDDRCKSMISRKARRWNRQHKVQLERLSDPKCIELALSNLVKLRRGRFDGDPIQTAEIESFYAAVAVAGAQSSQAETWILTSDGEVVGVLFGLTHQGRFLYLLIGADYDGHGRHSPGLQMYDQIIEDWISRGGTCFDFTIGDEPFKTDFGARAEPMSIVLRPNNLVGKLATTFLQKQLRR